VHTGLDPDAKRFSLVGRLNGWFQIGSRCPKRLWVYGEERELFL
jgi:hypothetical protein